MIFHWILSDCKSAQVSRTLLSILTVEVPFPSEPITTDITVSFMSHSFLSSLARSKYLSLSSLSLIFILWFAGTGKSTIHQVLFLFFFYHKVWYASQDWVIRLYLKIPENSMSLILQVGFWLVHLPFSSMVKFQFLAQFPVGHSPPPLICYIRLLYDSWFWLVGWLVFMAYQPL